MAKRTKTQKKLDRQRNIGRDTRVEITKAMLQGNSKEFILQLYCRAFQIVTRAGINDLKKLGIKFTAEEMASAQRFEKKPDSSTPSANKEKSKSKDELDDTAYDQAFWDETYSFLDDFTSCRPAPAPRREEQDDDGDIDLPF